MELKSKYQYTYFIHTFLINSNKYDKYIAKMLKDERFKLKVFEKEKDLEIYTYFLPEIRNFLLNAFDLTQNRLKKMKELPFETQCALLSQMQSITFEYNMEEDLQGKTIDENSIFFKIQKVGVICFNTGICFLYFKTNIEGNSKFSDILNFNYKFRDINQEYLNLKNYDNIKLQANYFDDIKEIKEFISEITGPNFDAIKLNLNIERFYTYSYVCIDQSNWNNNEDFENIKDDFLKYIELYPYDKGMNIQKNDYIKIISNSKYSKIGISKMGITLFSSDADIENYTTVPQTFENEYFYTYILSLYLKVYLKKIDYNLKLGKDIEQTRKEFVKFTKNIWVQEITSDDFGSLMYQDMRNVLEVEEEYNKVKSKYDILYRELKIEKTEKTSIFIAVVLVITLIINIINWLI